jgi:hypothetical protein
MWAAGSQVSRCMMEWEKLEKIGKSVRSLVEISCLACARQYTTSTSFDLRYTEVKLGFHDGLYVSEGLIFGDVELCDPSATFFPFLCRMLAAYVMAIERHSLVIHHKRWEVRIGYRHSISVYRTKVGRKGITRCILG